MFQFLSSHDGSGKNVEPLNKIDIEYVQTIFIILCCTVYLLKELTPEFKDKLSHAFTFLFRTIITVGFIYSIVIHTPWKSVIESFISTWIQKIFK